MAIPDDVKPGQRLFRMAEFNGQITVLTCWFVHRRRGWVRFRNIYTGEEWNERSGVNVFDTPQAALWAYMFDRGLDLHTIGHELGAAGKFWQPGEVSHACNRIYAAFSAYNAFMIKQGAGASCDDDDD
jgi:hypothetical protein